MSVTATERAAPLVGEPLTARVLAASVVIVGAVVLITRARAPRGDARRT